jgi:hypothetical protein
MIIFDNDMHWAHWPLGLICNCEFDWTMQIVLNYFWTFRKSKINLNDDDFVRVNLGGMGYNHRSYIKTIPNYKFIKGQIQTIYFLNKHFTICNVSKCPYGS